MNELWSLVLVGGGASLHALWNYLVKKHGSGDVLFVWCYSVVAAPLSLGLLVAWSAHGGSLGRFWWAGLVSMVLHTAYAVILQKAYVVADMSLIYPISRGLAPVLVTLVALAWAPMPGLAGWFGMGLVVAGVVCVGDLCAAKGRKAIRGAGLGALVAAVTASYTLWDAYSAQVLRVSVLPYMALSSIAQAVFMTGVCWSRRSNMRKVLRRDWVHAFPIAILAPASYALVLLAMRLGPPSMVATARSLNIVFGAIMAVVFLHEKTSRTTWIGMGLIVAGAITGAL